MNNKRTSNLLRLIAFFLTGVILVCTFGFTVDGWLVIENNEHSQDSAPSTEADNGSSNVTVTPEDIPEVVFYNKLTVFWYQIKLKPLLSRTSTVLCNFISHRFYLQSIVF